MNRGQRSVRRVRTWSCLNRNDFSTHAPKIAIVNEPENIEGGAQGEGSVGVETRVSAGTRIALWSAALLVLAITFVAYDQVALALQWVVMKLC